MKQVTDNDLVLLFYGEHEDASLAARVAQSKELSARFEALCADLKRADAYEPPERGEDYGAEVWQRISPHLTQAPTRNAAWRAWFPSFSEPRFSLAGVLGIALVAAVAFMLGRNGGPVAEPGVPGTIADSAALIAGIDSSRLLASSVSGHLEQVDRVLTQFANSSESTDFEADWATDMLVANRLYRQAAAAQGSQKLAVFLGELEPLLIELAYEAQTASAATRERMQQEVNDGLLFRVRVVNQQLKNSRIST